MPRATTDAVQRSDRPKRTPSATERVYGLAAALAVLSKRPEQVVNIAHTAAVRRALSGALREAARRHIAYREVSDAELTKIAASVHHEGVCVLVRRKAATSLSELARSAEPHGLLVALEHVSNPHNVGAVVRTAAFFGVRGVLLADVERLAWTPAATRVAEGGAEHLGVVHVERLAPALQALRASGLAIIAADGQAETALGSLRWPARAVLVLGSENAGLSAEVRESCDQIVRITGSGAIESLNVSVAAGISIASYAAVHGARLDASQK